MATNVEEEVLRILYEVQGQKALDDAQKDLANVDRLMDHLRESGRSGALGLDELERQARTLARSADEARAKLDALGKVRDAADAAASQAAIAGGLASPIGSGPAQREAIEGAKLYGMALEELAAKGDRAARGVGTLGRAAAAAGKSSGSLGRSLLETGRIVQDVTQGGIGGALNNIEGLTAALGLGGGLAGVLTVVGVGFYLLRPKIQEFFDSLANPNLPAFTDKAAKLQETIKELSEKPHKLALDLQKLDEAKAKLKEIQDAQAALERLMGTKGEDEKALAGAADKAIAAFGGGKEAVRKLARPYADRVRSNDVRGDLTEEQVRAMAEKFAKDDLAGAQGGNRDAYRRLIDVAGRDKSGVSRYFAKDLEEGLPENVRARAERKAGADHAFSFGPDRKDMARRDDADQHAARARTDHAFSFGPDRKDMARRDDADQHADRKRQDDRKKAREREARLREQSAREQVAHDAAHRKTLEGRFAGMGANTQEGRQLAQAVMDLEKRGASSDQAMLAVLNQLVSSFGVQNRRVLAQLQQLARQVGRQGSQLEEGFQTALDRGSEW